MRKHAVATALLAGLLATFVGSGTALAAPGNNGDIQVQTSINADGTPGCSFDLQYNNFDAGTVSSTYTYTLQAPTTGAGDGVLSTGTVALSGGPGRDATVTFDLSATLLASGAMPSSQGYHVKVVTASTYSNGNDTKSKVFWAQACDDIQIG